jgi:NAD(P)-dependent dehydrogenase (short-subunit alcohol dehydrogenase family)
VRTFLLDENGPTRHDTYLNTFHLLSVGTNHFGHFYLNHQVLPFVDPNGKIIVTASGVHDPESPGGAQGEPAGLGNLDGLAREGKSCEMIDGSPFNADKAYKDSKVSQSYQHFVPLVPYSPP